MKCGQRCGLMLLSVAFLTAISWAQAGPVVMDKDGYILNWLVCGPFPAHMDDGKGAAIQGYDYDFLAGNGGEDKIVPTEGMAVTCSFDKTTKKWQAHESKSSLIDFNAIYTLSPMKVAYAYTQFDVAEPFHGALAAGSDDGVKIWVNGKVVLDRHVKRGYTKDEDTAPVEFVKGRNAILVKVENGKEDFCFSLRPIADKRKFAEFCKSSLSLKLNRTVVVSDAEPVLATVEAPSVSGGRYQAEIRAQMTDPTGKTSQIPGKYAIGQSIAFPAKKEMKGTYKISLTVTDSTGPTTLNGQFHYLPELGQDIQAWERNIAQLKPGTGNRLHDKVYANLSVRMIALKNLATRLDNPDQAQYITLVIGQMSQIMDSFRQGKDYFEHRPGNFLKAYRSDQDYSIQPYTICVPKSYDPKKKHPLVINLHGNGAPAYNKQAVILGGCNLSGVAENEFGIINVAPYGRGNYGYLLLGEDDILRVMDEVMRDYAVDPARVYIRGFSLGGWGTFSLAARYPHRFAAICPSGGPCDSRLHNHGDYRVSWQIPDVITIWGSIFFAENYRNVPALIHQGGADPVVHPEHGRNMNQRLKDLGYCVKYVEHAGLGHGDGSANPDTERWLMQYTIDPYPRHVVYKTISPRYDRGYWVTIDQFIEATSFAKIDVEVKGANVVHVTTSNVRQFSFDINPKLFDASKPLTVEIDMIGQLVFPPKLPARVTVRKYDFEWVDFTGKTLKSLYKHHGLQGPIRDAFSERFLYVYGTIGDENETKINQRVATEERNNISGADWRQIDGDFIVKKDTEVTPDDIKTSHLILIGRPASNKITNQIHAKLPIRLEGSTLHAPGPMDGKNTTVRFIYPNPLNPDKYVVVAYAVDPAQCEPVHGVYWGSPDFMIWRLTKDAKGEPDREPAKIGFFDVYWQFPLEDKISG